MTTPAFRPSADLRTLLKHCRAMAELGAHLDDCVSLKPVTRAQLDELMATGRMASRDCDGCVPDGDRAMFRRLADEIDAYLATDTPHPDQPTLEDA